MAQRQISSVHSSKQTPITSDTVNRGVCSQNQPPCFCLPWATATSFTSPDSPSSLGPSSGTFRVNVPIFLDLIHVPVWTHSEVASRQKNSPPLKQCRELHYSIALKWEVLSWKEKSGTDSVLLTSMSIICVKCACTCVKENQLSSHHHGKSTPPASSHNMLQLCSAVHILSQAATLSGVHRD